MYHGLLFLQNIDLVLTPKFQGNASGSSKSKKDRSLSLGRKKQECRGRSRLNYNSKNFSVQLA